MGATRNPNTSGMLGRETLMTVGKNLNRMPDSPLG